jgi:hypothetical protein
MKEGRKEDRKEGRKREENVSYYSMINRTGFLILRMTENPLVLSVMFKPQIMAKKQYIGSSI